MTAIQRLVAQRAMAMRDEEHDPIGAIAGDVPCEEYIEMFLASEMEKQRGRKRLRKKKAKRVLRRRWLMLQTARLFSRRVNYAEVGRQMFTVEHLPNPVEPIYLGEGEE